MLRSVEVTVQRAKPRARSDVEVTEHAFVAPPVGEQLLALGCIDRVVVDLLDQSIDRLALGSGSGSEIERGALVSIAQLCGHLALHVARIEKVALESPAKHRDVAAGCGRSQRESGAARCAISTARWAGVRIAGTLVVGVAIGSIGARAAVGS
jgi:hypothetical protein